MTTLAEPVVPTHTVADGDMSLRIQELWRAGRPIHMLVGEEIGRCGTSIQVAGERLTNDRRAEKGEDAPAVHVVFHDRFCGFYQGLPSVLPCSDKKTHILGVALQLALMSKEQTPPAPQGSSPECFSVIDGLWLAVGDHGVKNKST